MPLTVEFTAKDGREFPSIKDAYLAIDAEVAAFLGIDISEKYWAGDWYSALPAVALLEDESKWRCLKVLRHTDDSVEVIPNVTMGDVFDHIRKSWKMDAWR